MSSPPLMEHVGCHHMVVRPAARQQLQTVFHPGDRRWAARPDNPKLLAPSIA